MFALHKSAYFFSFAQVCKATPCSNIILLRIACTQKYQPRLCTSTATMPTCAVCKEDRGRKDYHGDQLKEGDARRCKPCGGGSTTVRYRCVCVCVQPHIAPVIARTYLVPTQPPPPRYHTFLRTCSHLPGHQQGIYIYIYIYEIKYSKIPNPPNREKP